MRRSILFLSMSAVLGLLPFTPWQANEAEAAKRRPRRAEKQKVLPKSPPPEEDAASAGEAAAPRTRGPTRIDFDDRLVQGQTNQSGAVYLYDRKELKQRSMVRLRESFREETVATVYDR